MHISFIADAVFVEHSEEVAYFLVMDGAGEEPENVLVFSCTLPSEGDVNRIHLEYNDQSNGAYGCIAGCRLGRNSLHITLNDQLGQLEDVDGFEVELALDDDMYEELKEALALIWADNPLLEQLD
jgi:hypothetical protein